MKLGEFAKNCELAGAKCKEKGGSLRIRNGKNSIKISKSTHQLDGPVVAKYLRILGLNPTASGIDIKEFEAGANPGEKQHIYRFISALRRLAKT